MRTASGNLTPFATAKTAAQEELTAATTAFNEATTAFNAAKVL